MGKGIFITGTDTGVGKTIASACLISLLKDQGLDIGVMKPVETGCPRKKGKLIPQDALFLKTVSGAEDDLSLINPFCFSKPLAPLMAATYDHKKINLKKISLVYEQLKKKHDIIIAEGAGGLLVPLTREKTNLDLILSLHLPVILVVGSRLGAVNHTLLTLYRLKESGVKVIGLLINRLSSDGEKISAEKTNKDLIKLFTDVPILGEIPFLGRNLRPDLFIDPSLLKRLRRNIDLKGDFFERGR